MVAPLLMFTLAASAAGRPADAGRELFKGAALYRTCQAEMRLMELPSLSAARQPDLIDGSYCVGFLNGFTGNLNAARNEVCPGSASMGEVVRTYVAYMDRNPKLMTEDRRVGLRLALQEAYPCPVSPEQPRLEDPATARPRVL